MIHVIIKRFCNFCNFYIEIHGYVCLGLILRDFNCSFRKMKDGKILAYPISTDDIDDEIIELLNEIIRF